MPKKLFLCRRKFIFYRLVKRKMQEIMQKNGLYLGHIIVKVCSAEGTLGWFLEGVEFAVKQQTADRTSEANGI